jgi:hypothetical protein
MKPVARSNLKIGETRFEHRLHCGDGPETAGPREGDFERSIVNVSSETAIAAQARHKVNGEESVLRLPPPPTNNRHNGNAAAEPEGMMAA